MTTDTETTIQSLAAEAVSFFQDGPRDSEDTRRKIRTVKDGAPQWVTDLVHEAHGDYLPDDFRYEFIEEALDAFSEADDLDDVTPREEIMNAEGLRWVASRLDRTSYCDEYAASVGVPDDLDTMALILSGMMTEKDEVYSSVRAFLQNRLDELAENS